jgi:hypothetical protein
MIPPPLTYSYSSHDDAYASSFSIRRVFLLLSLLSSLVAWLALYLPWSADGGINGIGTPLGTYSLDWAATGWSLGASVLLGLNVICSLLWLWRVTRLASLLIWGVEACLSLWMIFSTALALVYDPTVVGPWVYTCALVGMVLCDFRVRKHYRFPEILTIPLGEETLRPPWF